MSDAIIEDLGGMVLRIRELEAKVAALQAEIEKLLSVDGDEPTQPAGKEQPCPHCDGVGYHKISCDHRGGE